MTSRTEQIEAAHGGSWVYDRGRGQWLCDDGRYVTRQHTGGVDVNGEAIPSRGYFMYDRRGDGKRIFLK